MTAPGSPNVSSRRMKNIIRWRPGVPPERRTTSPIKLSKIREFLKRFLNEDSCLTHYPVTWLGERLPRNFGCQKEATCCRVKARRSVESRSTAAIWSIGPLAYRLLKTRTVRSDLVLRHVPATRDAERRAAKKSNVS